MTGNSQENLEPFQSSTRSGHELELQQQAENGREVLAVLAGRNNLPNLAQPHLSDNVHAEANANLIPQGENCADGPRDEGLPTNSNNDLNESQVNKRNCLKATTERHKISETFDKLCCEDFRVQNERQGDRNTCLQDEMFTQWYPMAPHNTTRYLMDEHEEEELDFSIETREEFLQRNFCEELETFHADKLPNMSENKRMQEYLELERCNSHMEEENKLVREYLKVEMFTQWYPMAPHNTTRYLMDEHQEEELDFSIETREEFLQRNFCEELETFYAEKLPNTSENKLVQGYLELERCNSHMEEENKLLRTTVVDGVGLWRASWRRKWK